VLSLISTLNGTFVTALVLDQISWVKDGMIGREFLLGVGRGIGTLVVLGSLHFYQSSKVALIFIGSLYFLFPLTLYLKKFIKKI
jgi:hypothetical protein